MTSVGWKRSFDLRSSGARRELPRTDLRGVGLSVRRGEGILGTRFGRRPAAAPGLRTGDDTGSRRTSDAVGSPVAGAEEARVQSRRRFRPPMRAPHPGGGPPTILLRWRGHSSRYWTIASVSALVALVAAGVTAGTGQHPPSHVAAQGRHGRSRPGGGLNTSGAASTGLAAPGGLLADAAGSAGPSSIAGTNGGPGSGNAPGGHVTLIGPATFTGAPGSPAAPSGGAPSGGGGAAGSPPPAGTNPAAPVASTVGSAVSSADVVGHDAREPDRYLRPGCGVDHRCREQCHRHDRSGGERVGRMTTANCRLVASRLRPRTRFASDAQQLITTAIGASNNAPTTAKNGA